MLEEFVPERRKIFYEVGPVEKLSEIAALLLACAFRLLRRALGP